ncbi:hypothetical protein Pen02_34520 [Plantactinospora endophytica]|uniref:Uncharacterized protein n=1 Tax=Plantactinospora endophytica TaxID=673535 RepID=A0ABQ4E2G7_9ACTN|nr:hypothetical protein Pen02_34520 [Plantactinospora endophytica]
MPYQPSPVPRLTRRKYRVATRATPPVELTEKERAEIQTLAPEAPPLPTRAAVTNQRLSWDASTRPHLANARAGTLASAQTHRARHGERA